MQGKENQRSVAGELLVVYPLYEQ